MVLVGSSALLPSLVRRVPRANGEDTQTLISPINGGKYNAEFRFGGLGKLMKGEDNAILARNWQPGTIELQRRFSARGGRANGLHGDGLRVGEKLALKIEGHVDEGDHHRNFHQGSDDGREGGAGVDAKY